MGLRKIGFGALLATTLAAPTARARDNDPASAAPTPTVSSHYLQNIAARGLAIKEMMPRLLTPREKELHRAPRPGCKALGGDGTYKTRVRPFVHAMGRFDLACHKDTDPLVAEAVRRIVREWKEIATIAKGDVKGTPLRILTKHYPRADLPGDCVTLQATFFTVRDPYFDDGGLTPELLHKTAGKKIDGRMFEVRKTYQIKGGTPRLIEATLDVSAEILGHFRRDGAAMLFGEENVGRFAIDNFFGAHFHLYGGGDRFGLAWFDRSYGLGKAEEWSRAFRILRKSDAPPTVTTSRISPETVRALKAIVARA